MAAQYPVLRFHVERDRFVVWLRWVSRESPPSPAEPPAQGIRVELQVDRQPVLGPTIVLRRDLAEPVYLRAQRERTVELLQRAQARGFADLQLVIHGSIAHAPWAGLLHLRDFPGEAIGSAALPATPLLQLQPSVPADRWQVAGQANLRVAIELEGQARRLRVLRS